MDVAEQRPRQEFSDKFRLSSTAHARPPGVEQPPHGLPELPSVSTVSRPLGRMMTISPRTTSSIPHVRGPLVLFWRTRVRPERTFPASPGRPASRPKSQAFRGYHGAFTRWVPTRNRPSSCSSEPKPGIPRRSTVCWAAICPASGGGPAAACRTGRGTCPTRKTLYRTPWSGR